MTHLRTVVPYFRPYAAGLTAGIVLVVVSNGFSVAGPWVMRLAIDAIESPDVTRGRILGYAGLIVGLAIAGGVTRFGMRQLLNGISRRVECDLRADFFRHLLRLDAVFYGRERTGDIMSRATNDTLAVRQAVGPAVMYAVNTAVMSTLTLALMALTSPRLTALVLIPMLLLPPVVRGFGRVIHRRFERIQEQFSTMSTQVQENLTGVRVVRAYVQEADQERRFGAINREYMDRNIFLVKVQGLFHPVLGLLTGAAMALVVWVGGGQVMAGALSVGDLVAFIFWLNQLAWPMIALGWVVNLFQRGEASMGRINAILRSDPAVEPGIGRPIPAPRGRIEFRDVGFRYPDTGREILRDLSLTVREGEAVAIVGPTGSGKSTLVSLIPRIYDPTRGQVLFDGIPVSRIRSRAPQADDRDGTPGHFPLFRDDRLEPRDGARREGGGPSGGGRLDPRVREASETAQLHASVAGLPRGYSTRLGERGINLSGGQKQRAALARALARDPCVLILDDALSAVDTETESRILSGLRDSLRGRTSLVISHRVTAVMHADRILVMDEGEIVGEGTHEELLTEQRDLPDAPRPADPRTFARAGRRGRRRRSGGGRSGAPRPLTGGALQIRSRRNSGVSGASQPVSAREAPRDEEEPEEEKKNAGSPLEERKQVPESPEGDEEAVHSKRHDEERDREPGRIDGKQAHPLPESLPDTRERQDRPEDGSDAGRPPGSERHPDADGPDVPRGPVRDVEAQLAHERRDAEHTGEVEPEDEYHDPPDPRDPDLVEPEELAQEGGGGPEQEKDQGEPSDKEEREAERAAAVGARLEILEAHPGHEGEIGGREGEDAGREEGEDTRAEGDRDADGLDHPPLPGGGSASPPEGPCLARHAWMLVRTAKTSPTHPAMNPTTQPSTSGTSTALPARREEEEGNGPEGGPGPRGPRRGVPRSRRRTPTQPARGRRA